MVQIKIWTISPHQGTDSLTKDQMILLQWDQLVMLTEDDGCNVKESLKELNMFSMRKR